MQTDGQTGGRTDRHGEANCRFSQFSERALGKQIDTQSHYKEIHIKSNLPSPAIHIQTRGTLHNCVIFKQLPRSHYTILNNTTTIETSLQQ